MAKKTAFDDLFSDDFGKLGLQRLEELNAMALTLKENLKASAQTLSAKVRGASPSTASGAKEIENTKKEVEDLKKQSAELAKIQEKLNKATSDAAKEQAQYNLELKRQNQLNRENAILESEKSTQYEKNVVLLNRLSKQIMALGGTDKAPKELADEFNRLFGEVKNAEESVKRFQRNVGNYASATAELKALTKQLIDLELAGQKDSAAFREMQKRAAELSDTISDTKAEIKNMASDTKTIDGLVGSVNLLANGFQVFEGVMALTGETSEEWKETMVKLQAVMAITSGLQEIQNLLQKESAAMMFLNTVQTKAAAAAQSLYAFATGGATVATKAFRIALLSTGIGAIVVLIGSLAGAFSDLSSSVEDETEKQLDSNAALEKAKKITNDYKISITELDVQLAILAGKFKEIKKAQEKLFALKQSKEFGETVGAAYSNAVKKSKEYQESLKKQAELQKELESATKYLAINEDRLATETRKGFRQGYENAIKLNKQRIETAEKEIKNERDKRDKILKNDAEYQAVLKGAIEKNLKEKQLFDAQQIENDKENAEKTAANDLENRKRRAELIESERKRELAQEKIRFDEELKKAKKNGEDIELVKLVHIKNKLDINTKFNAKEADEFDRQQEETRKKTIESQDEILKDIDNGSKQRQLIIIETSKTQKEEDERMYQDKKKRLEDEITLNKAFNRDTIDLEIELAQLKKSNREKEQEEEEKAFERRKQFAQESLQFMEKISEETAKAKLDAIDKELSASEERESQLKTLAQQGQLNAQQSIALEEKRQAELESKREKALKRQREQAIILAGIEAFIASARAGSVNPSGDASNQVNGLLSNLEGALNKIKAFEKGGLVDGGEQLVRINEKGEEFVVKHDAVNKYGEQMLYDINEGRFNPLDYVSTPSQSAYSFSEPISTKVVEKLERVEEAIRTKPVPSWSVSEITKGVREDIREGNNLLRKHYERGNKLF